MHRYTKDNTSFEQWWGLVAIAMRERGYTDEAIASADPESFRMYYGEGMTPSDALSEDESYA